MLENCQKTEIQGIFRLLAIMVKIICSHFWHIDVALFVNFINLAHYSLTYSRDCFYFQKLNFSHQCPKEIKKITIRAQHFAFSSLKLNTFFGWFRGLLVCRYCHIGMSLFLLVSNYSCGALDPVILCLFEFTNPTE